MKEHGFGRFKENKGSSLIMALVVVSFIAVIAMTITTIALSSYKIKAMEAKTKNAFYNADMAVDEIYAGLARDAYAELAVAYDYVVSNLLEVDGNSVTICFAIHISAMRAIQSSVQATMWRTAV